MCVCVCVHIYIYLYKFLCNIVRNAQNQVLRANNDLTTILTGVRSV